ncbi:MAG: radical SAM protein [Syntrophomonadaceae bacterium]|nr:radical SAM protein [Syntrophomonadaceae bacterium]
MRYEGTVYRPPSEAESLLIQATIGCPHNKCTFCPMYKGQRFKVRPVEDIKADLLSARNHYHEHLPAIRSLFFPDGNTIILKTDQLVDIFEYSHELFPWLQRITVYGSAKYAGKKGPEDFRRLRAAGLKRIHMGMESGDDAVLELLCKGADSEAVIRAGSAIKAADIELSEYYLVGAGGKELSHDHALNSARTVSAFSPDFLRLRTLVPVPGTPLYHDYRSGKFVPLTPHQALQEIGLLIANANCQQTMVTSDHVSNYWNIAGMLPYEREPMLKEIKRALAVDESRFRPADPTRL